jgi:hypothetical protein
MAVLKYCSLKAEKLRRVEESKHSPKKWRTESKVEIKVKFRI